MLKNRELLECKNGKTLASENWISISFEVGPSLWGSSWVFFVFPPLVTHTLFLLFLLLLSLPTELYHNHYRNNMLRKACLPKPGGYFRLSSTFSLPRGDTCRRYLSTVTPNPGGKIHSVIGAGKKGFPGL